MPFDTKSYKCASLTILLSLGSSFCNSVDAAEPIVIFAITSGSPPTEVEVSSNNIIGIVEQVTSRANEFIPFDGVDFTASLTYLGVKDSIGFEFSGDGRSVVVTIPSANFRKQFTATSPDTLSDQLVNFLESSGSAEFAKLRKFVNTVSPTGISDGNPYSTTALSSRTWIDAFREARNLSTVNAIQDEDKTRLSIDYAQSTYEAGTFSGTLTHGQINAIRRISESVQLVAAIPFSYQRIEESEVFGAGAGFGLPIALIQASDEQAFQWVIAPFFGGMFRISEDLASGGALLDYGINSSLSYKINPSLTLTAIIQYTDYFGLPLHIEEFELDRQIKQDLATFGTDLSYRLGTNVSLGGHIHNMHYLKDAAVESWINTGAHLKINLGKHSAIRGSYQYIDGTDFTSNRYALNLAIQF